MTTAAQAASSGVSVIFNAGQAALAHYRKPQRVTVDSFEIDCTLSETHAYDADVTEFEVERGANINDHRRTKPAELSISGLVSDTPFDKDEIRNAVKLAGPALGLALDAVSTAQAILADDAQITKEAFQKLIDLYENGGAFAQLTEAGPVNLTRDGTMTVATKYRTYTGMVIKSLRFERGSRTGRALPFSVTFREIRTVETATAVLTQPAVLQGKNDLGGKALKDGSDFSIGSFDTVKALKKVIPGLDSWLPSGSSHED